MSVKYKLVLKKDLTQGATADAKRYYASAPVSGMMDFDAICELIAERSTASGGDEEKDFQANMIRKPKIIFTPGDKLRAMIEKVSLERIGKEPETPEEGGSDRPEIE